MSFAKKLYLSFGAVILLALAVGASFFVSARQARSNASSLTGDSLPGVYSLGKLQRLVPELKGTMLMHINSVSSADMDALEGQISQTDTGIRQEIKAYREFVSAPEEQKMYARLLPTMDHLMAAWQNARVPSRASQNTEALKLFRDGVKPEAENLARYLAEEYDFNKTNADSSTATLSKAASAACTEAWVLSLIALLIGAGLATYLGLNITSFTAQLKSAVHSLTETADQINSAAGQVASSGQVLAQGATEQAASLEETSASSQQISAMTQRNSQSSATSATLMKDVDRSIGEANQKLEQLALGMKEISASSDQIAKIIKVIDEIAFQTNILALNAAVEAARAGEAGMGFAVVADEVRNLAQRCAQATKDIAVVIETSVTSARNGGARLAEVKIVVADVTDRTRQVKTLVDEVNQGGVEHTRGIEQISRALLQMEKITQEVAANTEETASASEQLNAQANGMHATVRDLETLVSGRR